MIFCTAVCANHMAKAITMAKSLKEHMPDSKLIVCLLELEMMKEAESCPYFDEVVLPKEMGIHEFYSFIFKYSIYEAACAVKAQLLIYTMGKYPDREKFVYIDSDVKIYSRFKEIEEILKNEAIILTPHHLEPMDHISEIIRIEENQLRVGSFNMGFIALRRSKEAEQFLKWWNERLYHFCYLDLKRGLFLDQKWIDLAPGLFRVHILKHSGYNIGNWNLPKRNLYVEKGEKKVNGEALCFIHFSGIGSWFEQYLKEFVKDKGNLLYSLLAEYKQDLEQAGNQKYKDRLWSFDYFWSGEYINQESRVIFREKTHLFKNKIPFELSNLFFQNR
ncbi:hypothetical protein [Neobacillus terrae]|uniref:hypothetical protein n=1 Tax=Neobacillus terrae TaxID=3034837 RepID=UPI00140B7418|nr:hypothetical protein [Neobacillus terrae]NHM31133.1 hypothetical protein [Neobacillus terrae]